MPDLHTDDQARLNETSRPSGSVYAACVSLLDAAISLVCHNYCLLSIYTLHNAAPRQPRCLESGLPGSFIRVRGPGPGFNGRSMQIMSSYGECRTRTPGHKTPGLLIILTTSHLPSSSPSSPVSRRQGIIRRDDVKSQNPADFSLV